jgi:pimeloyl-ACP methyl ester carboxylesterase
MTKSHRTVDAHARHFTGPYRRQDVPGAGHNLPQEKPDVILAGVRSLQPQE